MAAIVAQAASSKDCHLVSMFSPSRNRLR